MPEKTYKARVEISLIVEIENIDAIHEDNAAAKAEDLAGDLAADMVSTVEYSGSSVCNWGVKCVEVLDYEEES